MKFGEQLLDSFCENGVSEGAVWKRTVVGLRAMKRLLNGGRALGRCILVSGLSTVMKRVANDKVSKWSAEVAAPASSRPDGVTGDTGGGHDCVAAQRTLG